METNVKTTEKKAPSFALSIAAIGILVLFVGGGYIGLGLKVDIMLLCSAACVAIMAMTLGYTYADLEAFICERISKTMSTILIIWAIGTVIGTFIFCGAIPMVIRYGVMLIKPSLVIPMSFVLCAIFSTVTGTSWGSAGTAGVACIGIAAGLGVSLPMTAAAIVCGATFGDKISPLSDTTNLAPLCAGCTLYQHIGSMMWTTTPASLLALAGFFILGHTNQVAADGLPQAALDMIATLDGMFNWSILLIIPFVVIVIGAITKKPPVPTMLAAALLAILIGCFYQGFSIQSGVLSLICFVVFYVWYLISSIRIYYKIAFDNTTVVLGFSIMLGTLGYMVMGLTNDSTVTVAPLYWLMIGIGVGINTKLKKTMCTNTPNV